METSTYDLLWDKIIYPRLNRELLRSKNLELKNKQKIKSIIWTQYEKVRKNVHSYMKDPQGKIDRHKVASAMASAIMMVRPLKVKNNDSHTLMEDRLANETLAFSVALATVISFILSTAKESGDSQNLEYFTLGFAFPPCSHGSTYVKYIYEMLYYSYHNGKFDFFTFSNLLFVLEEYTKVVRQSKALDLC